MALVGVPVLDGTLTDDVTAWLTLIGITVVAGVPQWPETAEIVGKTPYVASVICREHLMAGDLGTVFTIQPVNFTEDRVGPFIETVTANYNVTTSPLWEMEVLLATGAKTQAECNALIDAAVAANTYYQDYLADPNDARGPALLASVDLIHTWIDGWSVDGPLGTSGSVGVAGGAKTLPRSQDLVALIRYHAREVVREVTGQ